MKPFPLSTNRKANTTVRGPKPASKGPKPKNPSAKAATPPVVKTKLAAAKKRKKTMTRPLPPYDDEEDDEEEEVEVTKAVLEEDEEEEETDDHPGKRKKAQKLVNKQPRNFEVMKKHYRLAARQCVRFTNAWVTTQATLLHGFKLRGILESLDNDNGDNGDGDKDEDEEKADEDKETPDNFIGMDVYDALVTYIFPNIEQNVQWLEGQADPEDPLQFIFELLSSINAGTRSGRTDDTSKINDNIIRYSTTNISDDTPVLDIRKYRRGFNHVHTARLLCPQRWLNDFDKDPHLTAVRAMMVELPTKVTPRYLPSFLYDQTLVNAEDPRAGLFMGHTCIRSFHAIYLGNGEHDATDLHSTVKSKMSLCTVTAQMVVYAVIQARFALSSCGKWGEMSDDFDLERFSVKLIKIFTNSQKDEGDDWATDTLKHYTTEVLKPKPKDDDDEEIDEDDDESVLERRRRRRIKQQQRAAAAAAEQEDAAAANEDQPVNASE